MDSRTSVSGLWRKGFDEEGLKAFAEELRRRLEPNRPTLGLVFMTPDHFAQASQILEILRLHARIPMLAGCSSTSLIAGSEEAEDKPGIVLGLYALPGAELHAFHFTQEDVGQAEDDGYWEQKTGMPRDAANGWLVFADPFRMDCESWLRTWNEAYAPSPVLGGLATGTFQEQATQVYLNDMVYEEGGIGIAFGGSVTLKGVISQGCTPIGETWTITHSERNLIHAIGNRPAYEVLMETYNELTSEEQGKTRGNLFVGLVINEYLEDFHRGDFLVRNLIGADPKSGVVAVGALPRQGQTLQFQRRDAEAATEDMSLVLEKARGEVKGSRILGGCLFACNGRGSRLFGRPNHDAEMVQEKVGPLGLSGFFCNGEIGPVGSRNFLHGYTAALALFVDKEPSRARVS